MKVGFTGTRSSWVSCCVCGHPREWHASTWARDGCHADFLTCECADYRNREEHERARLAREDFGDR